jgi:hypothetical protein
MLAAQLATPGALVLYFFIRPEQNNILTSKTNTGFIGAGKLFA